MWRNATEYEESKGTGVLMGKGDVAFYDDRIVQTIDFAMLTINGMLLTLANASDARKMIPESSKYADAMLETQYNDANVSRLLGVVKKDDETASLYSSVNFDVFLNVGTPFEEKKNVIKEDMIKTEKNMTVAVENEERDFFETKTDRKDVVLSSFSTNLYEQVSESYDDSEAYLKRVEREENERRLRSERETLERNVFEQIMSTTTTTTTTTTGASEPESIGFKMFRNDNDDDDNVDESTNTVRSVLTPSQKERDASLLRMLLAVEGHSKVERATREEEQKIGWFAQATDRLGGFVSKWVPFFSKKKEEEKSTAVTVTVEKSTDAFRSFYKGRLKQNTVVMIRFLEAFSYALKALEKIRGNSYGDVKDFDEILKKTKENVDIISNALTSPSARSLDDMITNTVLESMTEEMLTNASLLTDICKHIDEELSTSDTSQQSWIRIEDALNDMLSLKEDASSTVSGKEKDRTPLERLIKKIKNVKKEVDTLMDFKKDVLKTLESTDENENHLKEIEKRVLSKPVYDKVMDALRTTDDESLNDVLNKWITTHKRASEISKHPIDSEFESYLNDFVKKMGSFVVVGDSFRSKGDLKNDLESLLTSAEKHSETLSDVTSKLEEALKLKQEIKQKLNASKEENERFRKNQREQSLLLETRKNENEKLLEEVESLKKRSEGLSNESVKEWGNKLLKESKLLNLEIQKNDELQRKNENLTAELKRKETETLKKQKDLEKMEKESKIMEERIEKMQERIVDINERLWKKEKMIDEKLRESESTFNENLEALKKEKKGLETELKETSEKLKESKKKAEEYEEILKESQKELEETKKKLEESEKLLKACKENAERLELKIKELENIQQSYELLKSKHETEYKTLKEKEESLNSELSKTRDELTRLKEEYETARVSENIARTKLHQKEMSEKDKKNLEMESNMQKFEKKIKELNAELEESKRVSEAQKTKFESNQQKLKEAEEKLKDELKTEKAKWVAEKIDITNELEKKKTKIEKTDEEKRVLDRQIRVLESEKTVASANLLEKTKELEETKNKLERSTNDYESSTLAIEKLEKERNESLATVRRLEEEAQTLKERLKSCESGKETTTKELDFLNSYNNELIEMNELLKSSEEELKNLDKDQKKEIQELKEMLSLSKQNVDRLTKELETIKKESYENEERIKALSKEIETISSENETYRAEKQKEIEELNKRDTGLESTIKEKENEIQRLTKDVESKEASLTDLQKQNETSTMEHQTKVNELNGKIQNLKNQIESELVLKEKIRHIEELQKAVETKSTENEKALKAQKIEYNRLKKKQKEAQKNVETLKNLLLEIKGVLNLENEDQILEKIRDIKSESEKIKTTHEKFERIYKPIGESIRGNFKALYPDSKKKKGIFAKYEAILDYYKKALPDYFKETLEKIVSEISSIETIVEPSRNSLPATLLKAVERLFDVYVSFESSRDSNERMRSELEAFVSEVKNWTSSYDSRKETQLERLEAYDVFRKNVTWRTNCMHFYELFEKDEKRKRAFDEYASSSMTRLKEKKTEPFSLFSNAFGSFFKDDAKNEDVDRKNLFSDPRNYDFSQFIFFESFKEEDSKKNEFMTHIIETTTMFEDFFKRDDNVEVKTVSEVYLNDMSASCEERIGIEITKWRRTILDNFYKDYAVRTKKSSNDLTSSSLSGDRRRLRTIENDTLKEAMQTVQIMYQTHRRWMRVFERFYENAKFNVQTMEFKGNEDKEKDLTFVKMMGVYHANEMLKWIDLFIACFSVAYVVDSHQTKDRSKHAKNDYMSNESEPLIRLQKTKRLSDIFLFMDRRRTRDDEDGDGDGDGDGKKDAEKNSFIYDKLEINDASSKHNPHEADALLRSLYGFKQLWIVYFFKRFDYDAYDSLFTIQDADSVRGCVKFWNRLDRFFEMTRYYQIKNKIFDVDEWLSDGDKYSKSAILYDTIVFKCKQMLISKLPLTTRPVFEFESFHDFFTRDKVSKTILDSNDGMDIFKNEYAVLSLWFGTNQTIRDPDVANIIAKPKEILITPTERNTIVKTFKSDSKYKWLFENETLWSSSKKNGDPSMDDLKTIFVISRLGFKEAFEAQQQQTTSTSTPTSATLTTSFKTPSRSTPINASNRFYRVHSEIAALEYVWDNVYKPLYFSQTYLKRLYFWSNDDKQRKSESIFSFFENAKRYCYVLLDVLAASVYDEKTYASIHWIDNDMLTTDKETRLNNINVPPANFDSLNNLLKNMTSPAVASKEMDEEMRTQDMTKKALTLATNTVVEWCLRNFFKASYDKEPRYKYAIYLDALGRVSQFVLDIVSFFSIVCKRYSVDVYAENKKRQETIAYDDDETIFSCLFSACYVSQCEYDLDETNALVFNVERATVSSKRFGCMRPMLNALKYDGMKQNVASNREVWVFLRKTYEYVKNVAYVSANAENDKTGEDSVSDEFSMNVSILHRCWQPFARKLNALKKKYPAVIGENDLRKEEEEEYVPEMTVYPELFYGRSTKETKNYSYSSSSYDDAEEGWRSSYDRSNEEYEDDDVYSDSFEEMNRMYDMSSDGL